MTEAAQKVLPIVWGGLSNQVNGIKEALIIAVSVGADLILPPLMGDWSAAKGRRAFHHLSSVFDLEYFAHRCDKELGIRVLDATQIDRAEFSSVRIINAGCDADEDMLAVLEARASYLSALRIGSTASGAGEEYFCHSQLVTSTEIAQLLRQEDTTPRSSVTILSGAGAFLSLGGLGSGSENLCGCNYCPQCMPNPEFVALRRRVDSAFKFNERITQLGDSYIEKYFGRRRFLALHARTSQFPRGRDFASFFFGFSQDEVSAGLSAVTQEYNIKASDVFVAASSSFFSAVSDLDSLSKNKVFETTGFIHDSFSRHWVDQYISRKAHVFIGSESNKPDLSYEPHGSSAWTALVCQARTFGEIENNFYVGRLINALNRGESAVGRDPKDGLPMVLERAGSLSTTRLSSALEVGDYVPNFYVKGEFGRLDIQSAAGDIVYLFCVGDADAYEKIAKVFSTDSKRKVFFLASNRRVAEACGNIAFEEEVYSFLVKDELKITAYRLTRNLKVAAKVSTNNVADVYSVILHEPDADLPPPILVVPNVLSQDLADRLMRYADSHDEQVHTDSSLYKSRSHVHPDKGLISELDDKLVKSLLPEIEKVFYCDVSHRETYKVCKYAGSEGGTFGKHRDTIANFLYRRYAVSIILNDDYQGGGISFPEYSGSVVDAPKLSAVVFPGSLYHEVQKISSGNRFVIITFLFTEAEVDRHSELEKYRFTKDRDVAGLSINRLTPLPV